MNENDILIQVSVPIDTFLKRFKSSSAFFRRWRYSQNSINGMSNLQFGNFFLYGGYYLNQFKEGNIQIQYLIHSKKKTPIVIGNLKQRIKKIVPDGEITFDNDVENFNTLINLINHPAGTLLVGKFGNCYAAIKNSPKYSSSSSKKGITSPVM
jgi:hypothetical protein